MPITESTQTTYTTDDDQVFTDELKAVEHQSLLDGKDGVDAFIEQLPGKDLYRKKSRNLIIKFILFCWL